MFIVSLLVLTCKASEAGDADKWDEDAWIDQMNQAIFPAEQFIDIVLVGDRSGSMNQFQGSSQSGTREFVEGHRNTARVSSEDNSLAGVQTHLTVVTFDDTVEVPYSEDALAMSDADVDRCVRAMEPRATTRLYDTAIEQIQQQAARMREKQEDGKVVHAVFALLTDGQDNGSRRYSSHDLREHITAHELRGVDCMFVQAGLDAMEVGRDYGFAAERTLQMGHEAEHAQSAMRAVTDQSSHYARAVTHMATPTTYSHAPDEAPVVENLRVRTATAPACAFTPLERVRSC